MPATSPAGPGSRSIDWCYHGTVDETFAILEGDQVVPRPGSMGPQADVATTTAVLPFNDADALDRRLAEGDVACLLMEPALTNIGIVLPEQGYLDAVREITRRHGVLLIIDETHTLCAGPGGCTAAWDLDPDFVVVGKAIGGGVPAAAYGMTQAVADQLMGPMALPEIDVAGVGGTLTANALSLAAVRATLSTCLRKEEFDVAIPLARTLHRGRRQRDRLRTSSPGTSSASAAARSTGSAHPRATAPRPQRRSTSPSRRSSTSGPSTAASCSRRSTTWRCSAPSTPRRTSTGIPRSSARRSPP